MSNLGTNIGQVNFLAEYTSKIDKNLEQIIKMIMKRIIYV